jgi:DNA-binding IclR family transcriptional regulator
MAHVEALLLLLLLRRRAPAAVAVAELSADAQMPGPAQTRRCLDDMVGAGLLERTHADLCRYAPKRDAERQAVDALAAMYNEKPVTLVRAVYARPAGPIQAFADAFRLRSDEA